MRFGRGQNKDNVRWRFFQGLKQSIKGFFGEHVYFVDDVDFVLGAGGRNVDFVAQLADFVDTAIAGSIDFDNIQMRGVIVRQTINFVRQDTSDRGFARTTRPGQQIGVANRALFEGAR